MNKTHSISHADPRRPTPRSTSEAGFGSTARTPAREGVLDSEGPDETAHETLQLKLFLQHQCPLCSERAVAEEVRQLHHVQRVQVHPERHEIDVWLGYPGRGLLREIVGILNLFCCQLTACHLR